MNENQLQSAIVRKFSELHPEKRGQLFHVPNERNHALQAIQARSKGIFPGVSDLIYIENNADSGMIHVVGIELKVKGSRHKFESIEQQMEWGVILELAGGSWRLCTSVDEAISCTEGNLKGLTTEEVKEILVENKHKKTVKI